jgi:putative transposase
VATLMRRMGIEALYRKPRTSIPARLASIYPYLLEGLAIERPNQGWACDITMSRWHTGIIPRSHPRYRQSQGAVVPALQHAHSRLLRRDA